MDDETIRSVVAPPGAAAPVRIVDHDGEPENRVRRTAGHGVHERRPDSRNPLRYVLPPGALR